MANKAMGERCRRYAKGAFWLGAPALSKDILPDSLGLR